MRNLFILLSFLFISVACSRGNQAKVSRNVTLVNETPTYIKDRQLSDQRNDNLNNHGLYGPGFGESYASNSYREDDLSKLHQNDSLTNARRSSNTNMNGSNGIQQSPGYIQIDGTGDINSISSWDRNFINKYDQGNKPNTMTCTWHAPLKLNRGLNQNGQLCFR